MDLQYPGYMLQNYCEGQPVFLIQQALQRAGYSVSADGQFGPMTESAVISFQANSGLATDGIVGPNTWANLMSMITT